MFFKVLARWECCGVVQKMGRHKRQNDEVLLMKEAFRESQCRLTGKGGNSKENRKCHVPSSSRNPYATQAKCALVESLK